MSDRFFDPRSLAVDPTLVGQPLPSPRRRVAAFAVDYALLLLPTVAAALFFAGLALRVRDPTGYAAVKTAVFAMPTEPAAQHALMRDLAPLLVRIDADGLPAAVKAAVEAGDLDGAADRLAQKELLVALDVGGGQPARVSPNSVRLALERLIPDALRTAALFFVPAIYFAVATARRGTTVGKCLLGLRVVRLDGTPISLFDGVERFGAYFGILGTLGLGLFDLWRDPNRRLGHDRAVDTVVIHAGGGRGGGRRKEPRLHPMTESEEAFARRAVRRKGLFLKLSVASLIVAAGLVVLYSIFWWRDHNYPVGPRAVIVLLILLNARQNLRQFRYAGVLEQLLPPEATPR